MADNPSQPEQAAQGQSQTSQTAPTSPQPVHDATSPLSNANASGVPQGAGIVDWPVPHIMVCFHGVKVAMGREGIARLGRLAFEKQFFATYVWSTTWDRTETRLDSDFQRSTFAKTVVLLGVFYAVHGKDDVGPVMLGDIGWAGMVQNLVSMTIYFEEEKER